MEESPSLGPLALYGSTAHVSSASTASIDTNIGSSGLDLVDLDPTPRPLRNVTLQSSSGSFLRREATWNTPVTPPLSITRSRTISPASIPKRGSSTANSERRKRKPPQESPQLLGESNTDHNALSSFSSSPIEGCDNLHVPKQRKTNVPSSSDVSHDYEAQKQNAESAVLQSVADQHTSLNNPGLRAEVVSKVSSGEPLSAGVPAERAKLRKRGSGRAVTVGTTLETSQVPASSGLVTRRAASANVWPYLGSVSAKTLRSSDPTTIEVQQTDVTPATYAACSSEPQQAKKGAFLRTLEKLDLLGRSRSKMAIRKGEAEVNRFGRLSAQRSKKHHSSSSSSNDPQATRSRSTTTSSDHTDAGPPRVSDGNSSRTMTDNSGSVNAGLPKADVALMVKRAEKHCVITSREPSIATAKVDVVPEVEIIDADMERSVWIAIDITADVFKLHANQDAQHLEDVALDVVLCFDSSVFTSRATLSNFRSIAVMIACLLDRTRDRIAMVGSLPGEAMSPLTCRVMAPLQSIDLTHITNILASVHKIPLSFSPTESQAENPLRVALDVLSGSTTDSAQGQDSEAGISQENTRKVSRQMFLLSSNPASLAGNNVSNDVQIHTINPSIVPSGVSLGCSSGWHLHFPPSTTDDDVLVNKDDDMMSRCLRKVLDRARLATSPGRLTDLAINVTSGPHCKIEAVLGDTKYEFLNAGQTASMVVRVRVGSFLRSRACNPDTAIDGGERGSSSEIMFAELDALLGGGVEELVRVKVRYRHSLLPRDTIMSVEKTCMVKRLSYSSALSALPMEASPCEEKDHRTWVHCRLGSLIASKHPPRQALAILQDLYGGDTDNLFIDPSYLKLLAKELRHQNHRLDELGLECQQRSSDDESRWFHATTEHIRPLFYYHHDSTAAVATRCEDDNHSPREITPSITRSSHEDEARKIWRQMRKTSRANTASSPPGHHHHQRHHQQHWSETLDTFSPPPPPPPHPPHSPREYEYEQLLWQITAKALKNQRSLGADTLKSLVVGASSSGGGGARANSNSAKGELFAPWL